MHDGQVEEGHLAGAEPAGGGADPYLLSHGDIIGPGISSPPRANPLRPTGHQETSGRVPALHHSGGGFTDVII